MNSYVRPARSHVTAVAAVLAVSVSGAHAQNLTDADDFSLSIFGSSYGETVQFSETWDTIPASFDTGFRQQFFGLNTDFGSALTQDEGRGGFPKLSNSNLGLGAGGDGLDPRDGMIVLYSSIRLGTEFPSDGRIEVSMGNGGVDSANDIHARIAGTNVWGDINGARLVDEAIGSQGLLGNPGFSGDSTTQRFRVVPDDDVATNANPFYTAGSFDNSKYVHFATGIRVVDDTTGAYEMTGWYRPDAASGWTQYYEVREMQLGDDQPIEPLDLGDIGADHPFITGAKQGFINSIGFVSLNGGLASEVFYGRNAITQLSTPLLGGDANRNGQVEQGDLDAVLQNWGSTDSTWTTGDLNGSGQVEQGDLDLVLQNWGATAAPDFSGASVPEPAAGLLALSGAGLFRRRR